MSKRYLITYAEKKMDFAGALGILEMDEARFESGMKLLAEGKMEEGSPVHLDHLGITVIDLEESEVTRLSAKSEILAVEEDMEVTIQGFIPEDSVELAKEILGSKKSGAVATTPVWNIRNVKAPEAWAVGIDGTGINLAILDTGIADHPDLVISGGANFTSDNTTPVYKDENGHGTHCAGIAAGRNGLNGVYGVAKNCNLYAVKVLGKSGSGSFSWIFAGMNWCVSNNIQVASMSLGAKAGPSTAAATAVENCQDNGVTVIIAAGNSYGTSFPWVCTPANAYKANVHEASPVAVAAVNQSNNIASFSSRGSRNNTPDWNQVNVSAPGVSIYSTYLNNGYTVMSGTSMACPHVAGLAALVYQKYPGVQPQMVEGKIVTTATNLGSSPYPNEPYGYGLINCYEAVK
ncbi:MAG: S8 family peptidase [Balneolales bacterium]|nr:S8 family peptidase [Balneolales bacterium]